MDNWELIKDFIPYIIGITTTVVALKKDWISAKFTKSTKENEQVSDKLTNVDKSLQIFKDMLDSNTLFYKSRILEMEASFSENIKKLDDKINELDTMIVQQKEFISKQSKSLDYYERKYGKRSDEIK